MRRLLAVALGVALSVAGVAGATGAARGDPQKKLNAADQARAKAMLLRKADFGPGYSAVPSVTSELDDFYCKALDGSDLTVTGEAASGFRASVQTFGSGSEIYISVADATASWRRRTSAAGVKCTAEGFRRVSRREGVRFVSYRQTSFPSVAPRTAAFRWVSAVRGVRVYADIVLMMRSRAQAAIFFVAPLDPIERSEQVTFARRVSLRMATAMRGGS